jgi:hypothetical protein
MIARFAQEPVVSKRQAPQLPPGRVVIATINRLQGNTGVHTHTASLCDGFIGIGVGMALLCAQACDGIWRSNKSRTSSPNAQSAQKPPSMCAMNWDKPHH